MRVYKVVRRGAEYLYSFWAGGRSQVRYKPSEWAQAPDWLAKEGYHLLAFNSLEAAYKLNKYMGPCYEIWEAVGGSEIFPLPPVLDPIELGHGAAWHRDDAPSWPAGTCMFRRIKLVRQTHEEDRDVQTS